MRRTKFGGTRARTQEKSSALILVLFFVVLLTAVTIAFLSRSMTARQVSNSSVSEAKAGILANSAGDIIVGDLKQEIVDGSMASNYGTGTNVYYPKLAVVNAGKSTVTPAIAGFAPTYNSTNGLESDGLNNLVKRSAYGSPFYSMASNSSYAQSGPSRASNANSATASLNGRMISTTRWNSHYLLALADPTNPSNAAPTAAFKAPDWVIVTRGGANAVTWNSSLADPSISNTNYAVGRFAYAVYDEGGLLDMNVAGHPSGLTSAQASWKGSLALADLTALPISLTNTNSVITQTQIDNLVGWRNYASAGLNSGANGSYNNFTFNSTAASAWLTNFVTSNTNGFLKIVTPSGVTTPPTDQALLSRQQLISLVQSLGINQNALQYMGTFSRSVEQPTYTPDPNRPIIINSTASPSAPPSTINADTYLGNNDAVGGDSIINPALQSIRVPASAAGANRFDGTPFVVGEPLVKKKFPLSRLSLITYSSTNTKSATDPIYARFGLYRSSASAPWVYDHGIQSTASGGGVIIGTLSAVAAAGREPDFAELLKAAITTGSLGKAGPNFHHAGGNYQYAVDVSTDLQVLQIMANLIDQYDTDSYPTWIQMMVGPTASAIPRNIYGVEDLPYFYRYHLLSVVTQLPSPIYGSSDKVTFPANWTTAGSVPNATAWPSGNNYKAAWSLSTGTNSFTFDHAGKLGASTNYTPGDAVYMFVPTLWNPHDPNTITSSSTQRPTAFRLIAQSQDPSGTNIWQIAAESEPSTSASFMPETILFGSGQDRIRYLRPITQTKPSATTLTSTNTAMTFSDANGTLFREPTLLWNASYPSGVNLSSVGTAKDINTSRTYCGIVAGHVPVTMQATFTTSPTPNAADGTYLFQGTSIQFINYNVSAGAFQQITFSMQYQDPNSSGNWITYDVKYPDFHGISNPTLVVNTADWPNGAWQAATPNGSGQMSGTTGVGMDPRTARWGMATFSTLGSGADQGGDYFLENTAHNNSSTNGYAAIGSSNFTVLETQRPRADPGNQAGYSNPCAVSDPGKNAQMRWFSGTEYRAGSAQADAAKEDDGMFSQNNPVIASTLLAQSNGVTSKLYYEDPDGVARLGMAGYASTSLTDSSQSSLAVSNDTNRIGLPLATASAYAGDNGVGTATAQSQSRPIILNRPFVSVGDMGYAFRGEPWKNIDFFTPASGDSALLDVFCVNELPTSGMVAGKVDLNTRQAPVLAAVIASACRDEIGNASTASGVATSPSGSALPPLTAAEAANVAAKLVAITTDISDPWRGPLANVSNLVGHYVGSSAVNAVSPNATSTVSGATIGTDWYTYSPPVTSVATSPTLPASYTFAGLSGVLDSTVYTSTAGTSTTAASTPYIQRFREAALHPLMDSGQTRVWNLLIDVVAQTGRYPKSATGLDQFSVEGEKRIWLHVAIDRYTGQVIDKQIEVVAQ